MSREVHLELGADTQHYDSQSLGFSMVAKNEKHSPLVNVQPSVQDPTGPEDESRTITYDRSREFGHASSNNTADRMYPFIAVNNTTTSGSIRDTTVSQRPLEDGCHKTGFAEPDENSTADEFSISIDSYFEEPTTLPRTMKPNGYLFRSDAPPAGSTNSTNISPSQVATFRATSPSRQSGPREGVDLDRMSNSDLANYLDDHGAGAETLDLIVRERWSGNEWASTFCPEISQSSIHDTWRMLKISSLILKTRLMIDIRETLRYRQECEAERKVKQGEFIQNARERREIDFETAKAAALASICITKPQELMIKAPRVAARVEHAPRIPDHMHQPGSGHGDTFQIFCNTLTAWIAPHSPLLEAAVRLASQGASEDELALEISSFGTIDRDPDSRLVAQLYSQASVDLRSKTKLRLDKSENKALP